MIDTAEAVCRQDAIVVSIDWCIMLKMKAISSGVLVAIMLLVSCAARCEISCSIAGLSQGCHSSRVGTKFSEQKSNTDAMADMPGMNNDSSPVAAASSTTESVQIYSSGCAASNCQRQVSLAPSELNEVKWKPSLATVALLTFFYSFHDVRLTVPLPSSSAPPHVLPLDPLSQSSISRV